MSIRKCQGVYEYVLNLISAIITPVSINSTVESQHLRLRLKIFSNGHRKPILNVNSQRFLSSDNFKNITRTGLAKSISEFMFNVNHPVRSELSVN